MSKPTRVISFILSVVMIFYVYPFISYAADETEPLTYDAESDLVYPEQVEENLPEYEIEYNSEETINPADVIGEVGDLRDESTKHYRLTDGRFVAVDYGTPVHYRDKSDEWTDFDNTLEFNETVEEADSDDFAGYEPKKNDVKIKFAKNTKSSNLLKIKYEDYQIAFGIQNANNVKPIMTTNEAAEDDPYAIPNVKSEVKYPGVFKGVDLVYILDGNNIKEYFILSEEAETFEYKFDIKVKNVIPSVDNEGNVVFKKDDGTVVYTIPKGYMYDSNAEYSDRNMSDKVTYSVEPVKNKKYTLTISIDREWANSNDRVFPIYVDPSVVLNKYSSKYSGNIYTEYKNTVSGVISGSDHMYAGYTSSNNANLYIHMKVTNLPTIPDNCIICDASFLLYQLAYSNVNLNSLYVGLYEGTSASDRYSYNSTLQDYAVYSSSSNNSFSQYGVTALARKWYASSANNNGVVLRAINNSASSYANVKLVGCYAPASVLSTAQPRFIVTYRHTVGLESYYAYESINLDRAGTLYLNANTGQTVLVNDLFTTNNLAFPYTVSLIYNSVYSQLAFTNNVNADIHTADYTNMKLGNGWKLDSQTSIREISIPSYTNGSNAKYLIYCDTDGTEHYFAGSPSDSSIYKDEDGLGLQIKVLTDITYGKYKMTDDKNNVTMFSEYGYVVSSTDSNGNKITYNYNTAGDKRRLLNITVKNDGGETATVAAFTYDSSGYLTNIKDQYNRITTITYTSGRITRITYPDGKYATYDYNNYTESNNPKGKFSVIRDTESMRSVGIDYEAGGIKIAAIKENISGSTVNGGRLKVVYDGSEKTEVRFSGNDGVIDNTDDISNVYLFDYWGRCINLHTIRPSTGKVFGSSSAIYTDVSDRTDKRTNRINIASVTGVQPVNLLLNTGVETVKSSDSTLGEYYYRCSNMGEGQTIERTTEKKHTGNASLKLSSTSRQSNELYSWIQISRLTEGASYTLSAYAMATSLSAADTGGFYLRADGNNYSEKISKLPNSNNDSGWVKLNVTFTASSTVVNLYACLKNASGTVYFDDFQLIPSDDCDQSVSLLPNGGFENTRTTNNWNMAGNASYVADAGMNNSRCIKVTGSPLGLNGANYAVTINGSAKNTYVFSGWAKGYSVPLTANVKPTTAPGFNLTASIKYTDGTVEWHIKSFSADCKNWQYISLPIVPKSSAKTVSILTVYFSYGQNGNTVYFDNASLVADNCTAYTYDTNGNVVSVNNTKKSEITSTYSGADLTKYSSGTGATFNYTYDSAHNVTKVTWDGLSNALTYNAAGLATKSTLSGGGKTISTSAVYDSYGKLTSEKDQLDNQTSYTYNSSNGTLNGVANPDGSKIISNTSSSNGRLTQIYNDHASGYESTANLTYSSGMISQINQQVEENMTDTVKSQKYNFKYDQWGNITELKVGNSILAQNTYNKYTGALITSKTPNNKTLYHEYDILGRPTYIKNGSSTGANLFRNSYTGSGAVGRTEDFVGGVNTTNLFDSVGRLTNIIIRNRSGDNLRQYSNYTYDTSNRLTGSNTVFDFSVGRPYNNKFTYSASNGLLTSITATNTDTITPTYNALKQVTSVKVDHNDHPFNKYYEYASVSDTRTSSLPNKLEYKDSDSSTMLLYTYGYDKLNRITSSIVTDHTGVAGFAGRYKYDNYGKLIFALSAAGKSNYAYDATGNITEIKDTKSGTVTKTFEYDTTSGWKDRLIKVNGKSLVYSSTAPGLPTTYQNGRTYTLAWNGNVGELTSATVGGNSTTFSYFYGGLRKTKTSDGVTKNYYYDGNRLIAEKWSTGAYLLYHYDENSSIYAITYSSTGSGYAKYYLYKNLQGDVIEIHNASNVFVAGYAYDAWGNLVSVTDANGNEITSKTNFAVINPIRYRGYYYDNETGFYYLQSRYYDPANCRFISADTRLDLNYGTTNLNLFAYCGNNPIMYIDPSGHCLIVYPCGSEDPWDCDVPYTGSYHLWECPFIKKSQLQELGFKNVTTLNTVELNMTLLTYDITTSETISHFLAQCAAETSFGLYLTELGSDAYFNRNGYGTKYRGAGYIQVTWDYNYLSFSNHVGDPNVYALGADYVAKNYAWTVSGWWWNNNNMNAKIANGYTVKDVTRTVRGKSYGWEVRKGYFDSIYGAMR